VIGRLLLCSASAVRHAKDTKPHLCIIERNSSTPVRRQFSLTQEGLCRVIPGGEEPGDGVCGSEKYFSTIPYSTYPFQKVAVVLNLTRSFSSSGAAGTKKCLDLSSHCCVASVNKSRSWRRCSGSIARQARDSVALF